MDAPLIEQLAPPFRDPDVRALAGLLVDAVESGAAVSFLAPLDLPRAEAWWRGTLDASRPGAVFLVAREGGEIVGSVQLHPAWAPNQPHRADISKLLVHRRSRRRGLGARLMQGIEEAAQRAGFTLLVLDAKRGTAAERLYRRLGWTVSGAIPNYALDPDGVTPHDTVVFYKELPRLPGPPGGRGPGRRKAGSLPLSAALPGTWELVSRVDVAEDGERRVDPALGEDPVAILLYDRSGRFAAQFMKRDRSLPSSEPPAGAPNNSRAQGGYDAYFGTYTVDDGKGTVTQVLAGALSQENVGQVLTRAMDVEGDTLTIRLQTASVHGERITRTLKWRRVG